MTKPGMPGAVKAGKNEDVDSEVIAARGVAGCLLGAAKAIFNTVVGPLGVGAVAYFAADGLAGVWLPEAPIIPPGGEGIAVIWCVGFIILLLSGTFNNRPGGGAAA